MSEVGDEKPVGPNRTILEGSVGFKSRLEENKRLDETFIARFKKLRTEKAKLDREEGYVPQSVKGKDLHLGRASAGKSSKPVEPTKTRFHLTPFRDITITEDVAYLVKDLIPRMGLVVVWGPPKCGKSFWMFDLSMHIALGREYRGRRVEEGPVVYLALEGGKGFTHRVEAFRRHHSVTDAPFYLITDRTDLVNDHAQLIDEIRFQSSDQPAFVVIDTLNRSLVGSENSDQDMGAYIRAADAIREAFMCTVAIIHHCGVAGTRPRGHTSLTGAVDAQLAVERNDAGIITIKVEWLKDGEEGAEIMSQLKQVKLGADSYGDPIVSCVVVADDPMKRIMETPGNQIVRPGVAKLNSKARLGFDQLRACIAEAGREAPVSTTQIPAGTRVVTLDEWSEWLGKAGVINVKGSPREQFKRIREELEKGQLIKLWEDYVWVA
jgi:hypothetical protein